MPGLPSGRRVIALREVDEVARTRYLLPQSAPGRWLTISETCPPGEGIVLVRAASPFVVVTPSGKHVEKVLTAGEQTAPWHRDSGVRDA